MRGRVPKLPNFAAIRNPQPPLAVSEPTTNAPTNPPATAFQHDHQTVIGEARHIIVLKHHLQHQTSYHHLNDPDERVMSKILHHLSQLSNRCNKSWKPNPKSKTCHHRLVLSRLPRYEIYLC